MPTLTKCIAALCALALASTLQAQGQDELYRGFSAQELLDTPVRGASGEDIGEVEDLIVGPDGMLQRVVVQAGGVLFGLGASHIGVPWHAVRIAADVEYVQVPVTEANHRGYPLYNEREPAIGNWRVQELIHDLARLEDEPFYGRVHDVIFDDSGKVHSVVIDRRMGRWGAPGPYAHPYTGYRPGSVYDIPARGRDLAGVPRFDYVRLAELSRFSRADLPAGAGATR